MGASSICLLYVYQVSPRMSPTLAHNQRRRHHDPYTVVGSGHSEHFQCAARARSVERRLPATTHGPYTSPGGLGSRGLGAGRLLVGRVTSWSSILDPGGEGVKRTPSPTLGGHLRGLAQKVRIGPTARRNTELAHDAMPSVRASRAQARDHCACAREDPK